MEEKAKQKGIYLEPKIDNLPEYYDRDIIKVLMKNPKEIFVFWGISLKSFEDIKNFFKLDESKIHYKLYIRYFGEDKNSYLQEIYLPPFTTSYSVKFVNPVHNLRVEVLSYNEKGDVFSLMHSAHVNMPSNKPSLKVHKDWVNQKWVDEGLIDSSNGETIEIKNFWVEGKKEEEVFFLKAGTIEKFDGSSGGHLPSSHTQSSWGNRK